MDEGPTPAEGGGPKTWVVLSLTAVAAIMVAAVFVGWRMWRDDGTDDAAPAAEVPATIGAETTVVADGDGQGEMFSRTTDAGIELRMQLMSFDGKVEILVGDDGGADPTVATDATVEPDEEPEDPADLDGNGRPDFCDPVGDLAAWAITDDVVAQGSTPWTEGALPRLWPQPMWGGGPNGLTSIVAVVMQVEPDVESVRLTSPDGAVDTMQPLRGAAVLAVPVPPGADVNLGFPGGDTFDGYQLIAQRSDGAVQRADWDGIENGHPAWGGMGECNQGDGGVVVFDTVPASTAPAQELPEAGTAQPADPAAAEAEIEANFASLYGNPVDGVDRSGVIDDPSGLDVARRQVQDNGFGDEAEAAAVTIQDLVFVSPTEASFTYTLTTPAANFADQFGRARLLDGVWKITRGTLCQDMEKAGAVCPP